MDAHSLVAPGWPMSGAAWLSCPQSWRLSTAVEMWGVFCQLGGACGPGERGDRAAVRTERQPQRARGARVLGGAGVQHRDLPARQHHAGVAVSQMLPAGGCGSHCAPGNIGQAARVCGAKLGAGQTHGTRPGTATTQPPHHAAWASQPCGSSDGGSSPPSPPPPPSLLVSSSHRGRCRLLEVAREGTLQLHSHLLLGAPHPPAVLGPAAARADGQHLNSRRRGQWVQLNLHPTSTCVYRVASSRGGGKGGGGGMTARTAVSCSSVSSASTSAPHAPPPNGPRTPPCCPTARQCPQVRMRTATRGEGVVAACPL
jgi:hypothetical protein